jgi:uncharacterized protein
MPKAVLDTTILVSAFLLNVPGGASHELLRFSARGVFELCLCEEILEETREVLLRRDKKRKRYTYSDGDAVEYCQELRSLATIVGDLPEVHVVERDPNDDVIVACGLAGDARYIVTRDSDLLDLGTHEEIEMITPETFLDVLRTG